MGMAYVCFIIHLFCSRRVLPMTSLPPHVPLLKKLRLIDKLTNNKYVGFQGILVKGSSEKLGT